MRAGLFGTAGRLAAAIVTTVQLRGLEELIGEMDAAIEAPDIATFYTLNNEFHRQVVVASDNDKLIEPVPAAGGGTAPVPPPRPGAAGLDAHIQ
ncbi:FCD domain-containing protein [Ancylobacter dichloromethanicus]